MRKIRDICDICVTYRAGET